jgi:hypothetical protein
MTTAASFAWRAAVDVLTNPDYRFLRGAFLQWCSLARMRASEIRADMTFDFHRNAVLLRVAR